MAVQVQEKKSFWDTPLTAIVSVNWEIVILIALLFIAFTTRFYDLGRAAWSHDEAIHTSWSNDLYTGKGYIHNPIYHGPLLYHVTAATFFLLGDSDFSARVPPVLFGLVLIALPYFFRKWLGPRGWFITSLMLLLSPVVAHYSRVNRHDIYVEVFVVLMLLAIMKYLDSRSERWLFAAAAILAFSFTAMETTFIFTAVFAYFLCSAFTYDWFARRMPNSKTSNALVAAFAGIPFAFVAVILFVLERLGLWGGSKENNEEGVSAFAAPLFDLIIVIGTLAFPLVATPLFLKFALGRDPTDYSSSNGIALGGVVLVLFVLISAAIGLIWNWRRWTICAVLFYPIMLFFFTTVFTNPAGIGTGFIGSLGYWISQQSVQRGNQPQYYYMMVTLPMYEYLPYIFGLLGLFYILWRRGIRQLIIFAGTLFALLAVLAIVWFTPGILEFMTQSVPFFKGKDLLQAGNTTVLLLAVLIPLFFILSYDPDDESTRFPTVIGVWTLGIFVLFSWAGEKMPWLTMHFAIPLSFLAGYFMNRVLDADWRELARRGAVIFSLVLVLGLLVLAFQIFFGAAPLQGTPIDSLAARASSIIGLLVVAICAGVVFYFGMSLGLKSAVRVLLVTVFAVLALLTVRTTALAAYINKDMATETIVYAQGTPDVPNTMHEIEELSRRLCAQGQVDPKVKVNCDNGTIKVAYDDDSSWPFVWYLRDYRNQQFYGKSPNAPFDAEVVIVGDANESAVKPFLGNRYYKRGMRLVWWPDESYKELTWTKLFGGTDASGNAVKGVLSPDNLKSLVRDVWFYHKYPTSLNNWPYVHRFSLYIRKDIANQLWEYSGVVPQQQTNVEDDPYLKKLVQGLQANAFMGTEGAAAGQFNAPKNIARDAEGDLYVADTNNHRIQKFDANRNFVKEWGSKGTDPGQFNEPWGIAVDKQGDVYVADTWNGRIQKFDKDGNFLLEWGTFGDAGTDVTSNPTELYGPRMVAIDPDNNVWVSDTGNKRILKFDPQGNPLAQYGGMGGDPGQFLEPVGLAIDKDGSIYVADTWNQRIQKFDKDFNPIKQWSVSAWDSQSVVNKPYLATDSEGDVYVTDPEGYRILKFSGDGDLRAVWGIPGNGLDSFQLPTGVMVDPDGKVYVADSGNNRILIFAPVTQ